MILRETGQQVLDENQKEIGMPLAGYFQLSSAHNLKTEEEREEMEETPYTSAVGLVMYLMVKHKVGSSKHHQCS